MCLSNMLCEGDVVELFDSMHTNREVDNTTKQQAATILCCQSPSFSIHVINVQQQEKGNTCGLFAIAMAFDLCEGKDPLLSSYNESMLRTHLYKCFGQEKISRFPGCVLRKRRRRISREIEVEVYCVCRNTDITAHLGDMVCCSKCENWFHEKCVSVPTVALKQEKVKWFCSNCI